MSSHLFLFLRGGRAVFLRGLPNSILLPSKLPQAAAATTTTTTSTYRKYIVLLLRGTFSLYTHFGGYIDCKSTLSLPLLLGILEVIYRPEWSRGDRRWGYRIYQIHDTFNIYLSYHISTITVTSPPSCLAREIKLSLACLVICRSTER